MALLAAATAWAHDTRVPRQVAKYRPILIREVRLYWGMGESPATFLAQVHQESGFRENVESKFASGLSQFTPATAEWIQGLYPADLRELCPSRSGCPLDARWALRAMVIYDRRLHGAYRFTAGDDRWGFALAAYNGGARHIKRERLSCRCDPDRWFGNVENNCLRAEWACRENRAYPRRILHVLRHHYE